MLKAEFGIIDTIDEKKDYSTYEPQKYCCVSISDDYLTDWWEQLRMMKTYFHSLDRPNVALARWGVTLIPPVSLSILQNIVLGDPRLNTNQDLVQLARIIQKAIAENKCMIHYGV